MSNIYLLDVLSQTDSKKLPCSILFYPTSLSPEKIAIIYLHDWTKYPYTASTCSLGQGLANQGYIFLSLGIGRRVVEGQMIAIPDDDVDDINRGIEYLKAHDCHNIILMGEGIGTLSIIKYQLTKNDTDIKGLVLIRPFPNLDNWLKNQIGKNRYENILAKSATEVIEGTEGRLWVDINVTYRPQEPLLIYQSFESWLSWWSPDAETKISDLLGVLSTPILAISPLETITNKTINTQIINLEDNEPLETVIHSWISELKEAGGRRQEAGGRLEGDLDLPLIEDHQIKDLVGDLNPIGRGNPSLFLTKIFPPASCPLPSASPEGQLKLLESDDCQLMTKKMIPVNQIITIKTSDNRSLVGLLWEDDNFSENKTIILHVRGKTGTPITEPLTSHLAEVYVKNKIATLVIELHRSGYGGSLQSLAQMDVEDIHAFVQFLLKRGYNRIILSGQSLGSNSIMRYCVQHPHPNIIAMVHFAPTQDGANWLEKHLGSETYNIFVKQAKQAIEDGQGEQGLIGKPPYDKMLSPHRPNAWLSWWGPDADTANLKTISEVTIPILMLCGSQDFFNDRERLDTLKAAATRSPITDIIWYEGCGHDFANFEQQAANDVVTWLNQL